jgi:hypothetical protein
MCLPLRYQLFDDASELGHVLEGRGEVVRADSSEYLCPG